MRLPLLLAVLAVSARPAAAQLPDDPFALPGVPGGTAARSFEDVADYTAEIVPAKAKPGEVVKFKLTVIPKPGCWTYPAAHPTQAANNSIRLPPPGDVVFVEPVKDPTGAKEKPSAEGGVDLYYPAPTTWELTAVVSPTAAPGKKRVALKTGTRLQVCNKDNCFNTKASDPPSAELEVLPGPAVPVPPQYADKLSGGSTPPDERRGSTPPAAPGGVEPRRSSEPSAGLMTKAAVPPEQHAAALDRLRANLVKETDADTLPSNSLWTFLLTAAAWGLISLATPCVFPMIPITVSLFLKQGHQSPAQVLRLAVVYCLTIIAVLGVSAVALLSVFRKLSVDPYMNLFLGGLFVVFALSLFGMYDITLPGFLLRYTEKRRGAGGLIGTVFGALAFSIVSFTCVAPFLGGFAGMASSGQFSQWQLVLGGLTFAAAFASPFFLLALFPSLLKKLPKSGGWLDTVKAVMGFLELAAALKFFRTAELRFLPRPEYFTYDLCMAAWVMIAVVTGLYLLNLFRLPHDEEKPTIGVTRLLFALLFFGLGVYLLPATFKGSDGQNQRPTGVVYAWVDSFLLPEPSSSGSGELPWGSDLPDAVERVRREGGEKRLIFADFTGVTCTNCKLNEKKVFPLPEVDKLLRRYALVSMYTDEVPAAYYSGAVPDAVRESEAQANLAFQRQAFGTEQLPLYVILEPLPDGKARVVGVYDEGKINDVPRFVEFLRKPLGEK